MFAKVISSRQYLGIGVIEGLLFEGKGTSLKLIKNNNGITQSLSLMWHQNELSPKKLENKFWNGN